MGLREVIEPFREPKTRMVGLHPSPPDHSTDNGLLFSCTFLMLLSPGERDRERDWFEALVDTLERCPGDYARYPGDPLPNSHDDLTGLAALSYFMDLPYAARILEYGQSHDWNWGVGYPKKWDWRGWLFRIIGFPAFIRVASGKEIGLLSQIQASLMFLGNLFEPTQETSGRCLLYLKSKVLYGHHLMIDLAIDVWKIAMSFRYSNGMRDVYRIYFGDTHPISLFAPSDFS